MVVIPKKDFPKDLNPLGLKRGDIVQVEIGEAGADFITIDPATMQLAVMRNLDEPREPIVKQPKEKKPSMADMPLPDLKSMLQNPPMPAPDAASMPPLPPIAGSARG